MSGDATARAAAIAGQIAYYAERRPATMLALDTPYTRRHFDEVMHAAALAPGASVCEWGSGLGRFSRLLLADGFKVSAIELSPELAAEASASLASHSIHVGDIADVLASGIGEFDAMLGFFVLHHLSGLPHYFRAAHDALRAGGRAVFVEPNPYCPLFPIQIGLTRGMRWHAERGIYRLAPSALRRIAQAAGFSRIEISRYGALPPAPYNWLARTGRERGIERLLPATVKPWQVIVAWR